MLGVDYEFLLFVCKVSFGVIAILVGFLLYAAKAYGLQAGEWKDVKYLVNLLRVKRASSNFKQKDMIIPRIWAGRRLQNPSATAMISGQLELSFQQLGKLFSKHSL